MRVYRSLDETPADFGPSALTIGNFDGVHAGHRRILERLAALARERGWKASALTFDPHPACVVAPERRPPLMTSPERRVELLGDVGIEQTLILPFTPQIAQLSPEEFARRIVVGRLGARCVLVGANFRFGHRQAGDVRALANLGRELGFQTEIVPAVTCRGLLVSSSAIRGLIRAGRVSLAARLLEGPYALDGDVVSGRGVGAVRTVPTLNLATAAEVLPQSGVYVTRTQDLESGGVWISITNIGYRPTFGEGGPLSIETFLLDPLEQPAPRRIRVEFLARVRDERRFESPGALKAQILKDAGVARRYARRGKAWVRQPLART
jgi:riboflavin kinase/FMN adenylyltransferase